MKSKTKLENLHIGEMIREISHQKHLSPKKLADVILKYQSNANKIYQLEDMNSEDIIKISYLLKYNILEVISKKYLSHLPFIEKRPKQERHTMALNPQTGEIDISENIGNCDFLKNINIGQYIRNIAKENGWDESDMAKRLNCSQGNISYLYKQKSLQVKTLINISNLLGRNLIAEVYLSHIFITFHNTIFSYSSTTLPNEFALKNQNDETF